MRRAVVLVCAFFYWVAGELAQDVSHIETYIMHNRRQIGRRFRPHYHVAAPVGWLNDPAGFIHYAGKYHLFYQFHPYNSAWGPMHWGHVASDNLVDWEHYPVALVPQKPYETSGCFSGSAVAYGNYIILFYTGNTHMDNTTRQTQNMAVSTDGVVFQKYLYNPIIREPVDGTWQFRHPKVFLRGVAWYMVIGNPTRDNRGRILIYTSSDLYSWHSVGVLAESLGDMGHVWENPDFFELDGYHVLLFSVHGLQPEAYEFRNLYQTGYVVGKYNFEMNSFENFEISTATFNEIDRGHDFYSAHTMLTPDGRRLMIAWMGMWQNEFSESADGWAGMMTLPRELRLAADLKVLVRPARELLDLRQDIMEDATYTPGETFDAETKSFELLVLAKEIGQEANMTFHLGRGRKYMLLYDSKHQQMSVDRGGVNGVRRAFWRAAANGRPLYWRIFVDASSVEVFCGDGDMVFSSRIYPTKRISISIGGDTPLHVKQYKLRRSVGISRPPKKI